MYCPPCLMCVPTLPWRKWIVKFPICKNKRCHLLRHSVSYVIDFYTCCAKKILIEHCLLVPNSKPSRACICRTRPPSVHAVDESDSSSLLCRRSTPTTSVCRWAPRRCTAGSPVAVRGRSLAGDVRRRRTRPSTAAATYNLRRRDAVDARTHTYTDHSYRNFPVGRK